MNRFQFRALCDIPNVSGYTAKERGKCSAKGETIMKKEQKNFVPEDRQAYVPWETEEELNDLSGVVSCGECTGLIPTPPDDEAEGEAYAELYPIPQPQNGKKQK